MVKWTKGLAESGARKETVMVKWMARIILAGLALVVVLIGVGLMAPKASAATWRHFGADKAYTSREAAIADVPRVLRQAGYPERAITLLTEAMKHPGVRTHVTNDMKLDFMRSGKSALWRDVLVQFDKPPVKERMEYSAPTEEWSVDVDGVTWTVGIPDVCNNTYGKRTPARSVALVATKKKCVELVFNALVGGKFRWGYATTSGPLPPDECNAQQQGDGPWTSWFGACESCIPPTDGFIQKTFGPKATVPFRFMVPVTDRRQTLRFSTEVWTRMVYLCLEDAVGKQTCGVLYVRLEDWKNRHRVEIADELWLWGGDSRCPQQQ